MPTEISDLAGPKGVALVKVWPDGRTSEGWGLQGKLDKQTGLHRPGFIEQYEHGELNARRVLYGYERDKWAFAFIMRSLNIVAIDIDGKNGGIEHANELLGNAQPTLAETSKSGTGYHLFYSTTEEWSDSLGFGAFGDAIGIVQGVDIRSVGCIYHHKQQRWNGRAIAPLPKHIEDTLRARATQRAAQASSLSKVLELDETERLLMHDDLITQLAKPIPQGKRNTTLFAIGSQMHQAQVPDWEKLLLDRAQEVGVSDAEAEKIVSNINAYAPVV